MAGKKDWTAFNVAERIIKAIEKDGKLPWHKPWITNNNKSGASGKRYRGVNTWLLPTMQADLGLSVKGTIWFTIRQVQAAGARVKEGLFSPKVAPFVVWPMWVGEERDPVTDEITQKAWFNGYRYHTVYCPEMMEDYGGLAPKIEAFEAAQKQRENADADANDAVRDLFAVFETELAGGLHLGADIAAYSPSFDRIWMPNPEQFNSEEAYLSTLAHEFAHSTGHESRLGRELSQMKEKYSKEELIAEIAAGTLAARLGFDADFTDKNSAAYVAGWASRIADDKFAMGKLIISAATASQKAVEYILEHSGYADEEQGDKEQGE